MESFLNCRDSSIKRSQEMQVVIAFKLEKRISIVFPLFLGNIISGEKK